MNQSATVCDVYLTLAVPEFDYYTATENIKYDCICIDYYTINN